MAPDVSGGYVLAFTCNHHYNRHNVQVGDDEDCAQLDGTETCWNKQRLEGFAGFNQCRKVCNANVRHVHTSLIDILSDRSILICTDSRSCR